MKHANLPLPEIDDRRHPGRVRYGIGISAGRQVISTETETARLGFVSVRNAHHNSLALRRFQAVEHADNRAGKR